MISRDHRLVEESGTTKTQNGIWNNNHHHKIMTISIIIVLQQQQKQQLRCSMTASKLTRPYTNIYASEIRI